MQTISKLEPFHLCICLFIFAFFIQQADAGSITGTVTDDASNPIAGVDILVFDEFVQPVGTAQTDQYGFYSADGIPDGGNYYVFTSSADYLDEAYDNIPCEGGFCNVNSATLVTSPNSGIDFALTSFYATVSGTVSSSALYLLPNLPVTVVD